MIIKTQDVIDLILASLLLTLNRIITQLQYLYGHFEQLFVCSDELRVEDLRTLLKRTGHGRGRKEGKYVDKVLPKNEIFFQKSDLLSETSMVK